MRRAVALWHRLADGSAHFDWLSERDTPGDPDDRSLIAFRVDRRVDRLGEGEFAACRLEDHRRLYLDYQGPIAGDRGEATRLATGQIVELEEQKGSIRVIVDWGAGPVRFVGEAVDDSNRWRFTVSQVERR